MSIVIKIKYNYLVSLQHFIFTMKFSQRGNNYYLFNIVNGGKVKIFGFPVLSKKLYFLKIISPCGMYILTWVFLLFCDHALTLLNHGGPSTLLVLLENLQQNILHVCCFAIFRPTNPKLLNLKLLSL